MHHRTAALTLAVLTSVTSAQFPTILIEAPEQLVTSEDGMDAMFTVLRSAAPSSPVTIDFSVQDTSEGLLSIGFAQSFVSVLLDSNN
ncbi:MAG: hypothetical protein AAFQ71_15505 [Planctomycetota bacterium]